MMTAFSFAMVIRLARSHPAGKWLRLADAHPPASRYTTQMELLALSRELIRANTISIAGTTAAVELLRPLYAAAGMRIAVQETRQGAQQQNLLGTYPGEDPRGLLLVTHLDTVDPGPSELWTETGEDPFALAQKGDRLFGLGAADTKLDALCKLWAAREVQDKRLRRS